MPALPAVSSRRDAIQQVIGRAAEAFLVASRRFPALLDAFVADLGEATAVSRAYVIRFRIGTGGEPRGDQVAEWCGPGVAPQQGTDTMHDFALADMGLARWHELFTRGEAIVTDVAALPAAEQDALRAQGIVSIATVPITAEGVLWGAVGFDSVGADRGWRDGEVAALRSAARLIGAAVSRQALDGRLADQRLAVEASESLYRALARHFPNGAVTVVDQSLRFVMADGQGFREHGVDPTTLIGRPLHEGLEAPIAEVNAPLYRRALAGEEGWARVEWNERTFEVRTVPIRDVSGEVRHAFGLITDLTTQLRTEHALREREQQLLRAQKVEALGRLAGGIAHDFNNLLTVIGTSAELALEALPPEHPATADVEQARRGAERGALLTRQLLAFARQQPVVESRLLTLNEVVVGALSLLQRVSGTGRPIELDLAPGAGAVRADRSQLEQILVNLVVNALDATRDGGCITVATARAPGAAHGLPSGEVIVLSVRDTGAGMDAETLARAFEPFFTTKPLGRGTGLGLATVSGLVEQFGGRVTAESAPGAGSTFRVVLPRAADDVPMDAGMGPDLSLPAPHGTETVLVVDDESSVRTSVRRLLVSHGYHVLEAKHGRDALLELERQRSPVSLVLTDVVMPELDGPSLAAQLRDLHPELPVLFMSGYASDLLAQHERVARDELVIEKPFTGRELLFAVRDRIDHPSRHAA